MIIRMNYPSNFSESVSATGSPEPNDSSSESGEATAEPTPGPSNAQQAEPARGIASVPRETDWYCTIPYVARRRDPADGKLKKMAWTDWGGSWTPASKSG